MARRDPSADLMARLQAAREDPRSDECATELRRALEQGSHHVVAKAAKIAQDARLTDLREALVAAFEGFMVEPGKTDKGCVAKTAIATALYHLEAREEQLFLRGIRHIQREGTFGGSTDTAAELRGVCALALVRCNYRDVMLELAELLVDSEPSARLMAARAVAYSENDSAGAPLLRIKVLAGDGSAEVLAECLSGLMKLSPRKSLEFVSRFLDASDDDIRHGAVIALGESRQPEAFELLKGRFHDTFGAEKRKPLLVAMALTRLEVAIDFILGVIGEADVMVSQAAMEAMEIYRHDERVWKRVCDVVNACGERDLLRVIGQSGI